MSKEGNPGCNALANIISGFMGKQISNLDQVIDYGTINDDYSLSVDAVPGVRIPKSEYNVCRQLTYNPNVPLTTTYCDGAHGHPDAGFAGVHVHNVVLPRKMWWIMPGERVIVVWIKNEANIVDVIYSGDRVGN